MTRTDGRTDRQKIVLCIGVTKQETQEKKTQTPVPKM